MWEVIEKQTVIPSYIIIDWEIIRVLCVNILWSAVFSGIILSDQFFALMMGGPASSNINLTIYLL